MTLAGTYQSPSFLGEREELTVSICPLASRFLIQNYLNIFIVSRAAVEVKKKS